MTSSSSPVSPSTWWKVDWFQPMLALTDKYVGPSLRALASKADAVWQAVLPYLTKGVQFAISKHGVAFDLFGASVVVSLLARKVNSRVVSTALTVAGLLIAGAGGYFLCSSGVLPSMFSIS